MNLTMRTIWRLILVLLAVEVIFRVGIWWTQMSPMVVPDELLGWRLERNSSIRLEDSQGPYLVKTNSRGLRDQEYSYDKPSGRRRIVAVGGSNVFGIGVPVEDTCMDVLERTLPATDVINMGCVAYVADQMYLLLKNEGLRYKPDVVLQFISSGTPILFSDRHPVGLPKGRMQAIGSQGEFEFLGPKLVPWHALAMKSEFLRLAEVFLLRAQLAGAPTQVNEPDPSIQTQIVKRLLSATRALVEAHGARHVAVMFPVNTDEAPEARRILVEMAKEGKLDLLDLSPLFDAYYEGIDEHEFMSWESAHMAEYGHYRVAEAVRDYLLEKRLLQRR